MASREQALAAIQKMDPRHHYDRLCLPCMYGDHEACRHKGDGPRFSREYNKSCLCEDSGHQYGLDTCREWITGDWEGHPCGKREAARRVVNSHFRTDKTDSAMRWLTFEIPVCGQHAKMYERRDQREADRRAEQQAEREARDDADRRCRVVDDVVELLNKIDLGDGRSINAGHTHGKHGRCDGRVALDAEVARAIAMRLLETEEGVPEWLR